MLSLQEAHCEVLNAIQSAPVSMYATDSIRGTTSCCEVPACADMQEFP